MNTPRSLEEGGDQFTDGVELVRQGGVELVRSAFYTEAGRWKHRPIEFGVAADVLGTDPYYAHSYSNFRCARCLCVHAVPSPCRPCDLCRLGGCACWVTTAAACTRHPHLSQRAIQSWERAQPR